MTGRVSRFFGVVLRKFTRPFLKGWSDICGPTERMEDGKSDGWRDPNGCCLREIGPDALWRGPSTVAARMAAPHQIHARLAVAECGRPPLMRGRGDFSSKRWAEAG